MGKKEWVDGWRGYRHPGTKTETTVTKDIYSKKSESMTRGSPVTLILLQQFEKL